MVCFHLVVVGFAVGSRNINIVVNFLVIVHNLPLFASVFIGTPRTVGDDFSSANCGHLSFIVTSCSIILDQSTTVQTGGMTSFTVLVDAVVGVRRKLA